MQFNTANELILETAKVVEETPTALLAKGRFMDPNGCMCALGHVAYKHVERVKQMVDGYRMMKDAGILDVDQLDIISDKIDDAVYDSARALAANLEPSEALFNRKDTLTSIMATFDAYWPSGQEAAVAAILGLQGAA